MKRKTILILCLATVALMAIRVKLRAEAAAKPHSKARYSIAIAWKGSTHR